MFILYGWGKKTNKVFYADSHSGHCAACASYGSVQYVRQITWFTLFFIPIIPYSFKYYVICDHCSNGISMNKKDFFAEIAALQADPSYMTPMRTINIQAKQRRDAQFMDPFANNAGQPASSDVLHQKEQYASDIQMQERAGTEE